MWLALEQNEVRETTVVVERSVGVVATTAAPLVATTRLRFQVADVSLSHQAATGQLHGMLCRILQLQHSREVQAIQLRLRRRWTVRCRQ